MKFEKRNEIKLDTKLSIILVVFELMDTVSETFVQVFSRIIVAIFYKYSFPSMWKRVGIVFTLVYAIGLINYNNTFIFSNRRLIHYE